MASELSEAQLRVLKALAKGAPKVIGREANDAYPAVASIGRKPLKPSVINALYRADLIDKRWEGLGNYTALITPAGLAVLKAREGKT